MRAAIQVQVRVCGCIIYILICFGEEEEEALGLASKAFNSSPVTCRTVRTLYGQQQRRPAYKEPRKSSRKVSSQRTHWKKKKLFFKDSVGFMENASMGFYRWTHRNTLAPLAVKHFAHLLILNPQRRMNWKELADPFRLRATPKEGKQICKGRWIIS